MTASPASNLFAALYEFETQRQAARVAGADQTPSTESGASHETDHRPRN